jgi:hypothetical protein
MRRNERKTDDSWSLLYCYQTVNQSYVCVHVHVHVPIHASMRLCMHPCACACACAYPCVCVCMCMCLRMHILCRCMATCVHVHYAHAGIDVHVHAVTPSLWACVKFICMRVRIEHNIFAKLPIFSNTVVSVQTSANVMCFFVVFFCYSFLCWSDAAPLPHLKQLAEILGAICLLIDRNK